VAFAVAKTLLATTAVWSSFSLKAYYDHLAKAFILLSPTKREGSCGGWYHFTL